MFEIQLPQSVMGLIGKAQGRGGLIGVWLLGMLFAVTTFTCTAPFVGTILAGAATSGSWTRPVVGMLAFSGVLAFPFFFLSVFPSRLKSMPRAGSWLNEVKVVMGFIELAAAFKFLGDMNSEVFTRYGILCAWVVIFGGCGLYLLGVFRLPHDSPKEKIAVPALMIALLCLGLAVYLTGGLGGATLHPEVEPYLPREVTARTPNGRRLELMKQIGAAGFTGGSAKIDGRVGYDKHYKNDYDGARAEAKRLGVALFIDFTGYA
ncbi:MAG: hypothetical protein CMJ83_12130 [Planctomycetes bacterium]|nr:hypothetical protein [Planctomycetota bacterium]